MGRLTDGAAIASPCTGVCRIDAASDRCEGCARTLDEIAAWGSMTPVGREAVMRLLPLRLSGEAPAPSPPVIPAKPGTHLLR